MNKFATTLFACAALRSAAVSTDHRTPGYGVTAAGRVIDDVLAALAGASKP